MNVAEAAMAGIFGSKGGGDVTKEYVDTAIANAVADKVDKVEGKGLSTNDYTNADKALAQDSPISSTSTTSPITDSADGMVQGITIYGRSEVVDGKIKSVGEGYAVVRLEDLTWNYNANGNYFFTNPANIISAQTKPLCDKYSTKLITVWSDMDSDKLLGLYPQSDFTAIRVNDYSYTTVSDFVASLGDATLCYQLADPTQGNTIAVKTDNGTGINGTMTTFTTALPLCGVSNTVRDKLTCTAESKQVETACGEVDLGTLTYEYDSRYNIFAASLLTAPLVSGRTGVPALCPNYDSAYDKTIDQWINFPNLTISVGCSWSSQEYKNVVIKNTAYTDATTFKAAMSGVMLVYKLATPTVTPLTDAEISAFRGLSTYDGTTNITITDEPEYEIDYLKNTENGKAVADIQKDLQEQIDSGVTYGINEVKTNDVWVNGKPIYRRTIQFTQWNEQFDATSMNIDNFFVDYAHSTFAAHTSNVAYTAPFVNNGSAQFDVWYDINNKMINMRTNGLSNNTLDAAYYTILYTKTTDTGNG